MQVMSGYDGELLWLSLSDGLLVVRDLDAVPEHIKYRMGERDYHAFTRDEIRLLRSISGKEVPRGRMVFPERYDFSRRYRVHS